MSKSSRSSRVPQVREDLDAEITALVDRVREVFGDEILSAIYDRARNVAIRQVPRPSAPASVPKRGTLRLVSHSDGFVRALRDELDRALTQH